MQIRSNSLRSAYHRVKAASAVRRIQEVVKSPHDKGKVVKHPDPDAIGGVPQSTSNKSETDVDMPTSHLDPIDPEFETDQIISGTGDGPSMGSPNNYI
jgi:hypothetical protein